jgi:hypothetical protein
MTSTELQAELDTKAATRSRTLGLLEPAGKRLEAAQKAFNDGGELSELTAAQSEVLGLEGALHKTELEIATLQSELAAAQHRERREAGIRVLCVLAQRGHETHAAYLQALTTAQTELGRLADDVRRALAAHHRTRLEFRTALSATPALPSNLTEAGAGDLTGISVSLGGIDIVQFSTGFSLPTSPYDRILHQALKLSEMLSPENRAAEQERVNEDAKRRREDREFNTRLEKEREAAEAAEAERVLQEEAAKTARHERIIAEDLAAGRTRAAA